MVVTIHGVYSKTNIMVDFLQKAYLHTFCRVLWNKAKAIVCLTQADANEIVSYGCPKHKITVIPNWVNAELFRPSEEKRENQILWVGRFVPPKGLGFLIKAAKIVISQFPECKFVLIGDGPLKSQIAQKIMEENLSRNFELRGVVPQDVVAKEMTNSSIFVFPSLKEGMPYSVLEAAASGMAIVASDIPGVGSILSNEEDALLVRPEDPSSLASAIIRLLDSAELRTKLQKNARKLIEQNYTLDIVFNKTLDLYERITRENMIE
jgi:glycosyltransferase involved in cell wall biosynthesis